MNDEVNFQKLNILKNLISGVDRCMLENVA